MPRAPFLLLLTLATLVVAACSDSDPAITVSVAGQFRRSAGGRVDLAEAYTAPWDRVCVLGPYTDNARAKQVLGFPWDAEGKTVIHTNDGITLLVFVSGKQVADFVEHPRNFGDFATQSGKCFPRSSARFEQKPASKAGLEGMYPRQD